MRSPRPKLHWARLYLPLGLMPHQVTEALGALATMYGAPRIVLETSGTAGSVQWWIGAPEGALRSLVAQLPMYLLGVRAVADDRRHSPRPQQAARLVVHGNRDRGLETTQGETTARAVLGALARTGKDERLVLQLVLGDRLRPMAPAAPLTRKAGAAEKRRLLATKTATHGFGCTIRIGVTAASISRRRQLIGSLLSALRTAESPGVALGLRRQSVAGIETARSPWRWPLQLSIRELACLTGWPAGNGPFAGLPAPHPRPMPVLATVPSTGRIIGIGTAPGNRRPVAMSVDDSLRHALILGPTGAGKSWLLGSLALQDIAAGLGVVVIDPKGSGSLVDDLLCRIPADRVSDVVVLSPIESAPVGVNPLVGPQPELAADALVHLIHELNPDSWGPRTQDILHASLLTLARRGDASLLHVPLLLTDAGYRRSVIGRAGRDDPMGLGSFWSWYDSISESERQTVISPVMNKLRPALLRPGLRGVLGQVQPRFDLNDVFTKGRILLVSLSRGRLGPDGAKLLGSIVVNLLWQAATRRPASASRRPVMVYVDELQDYLKVPGDLGDALATARGYGVGFTLATQHLGAIPNHLRSALLANARSKAMFQLAHDDAVIMARGSDLVPEDFTTLGRYQAYASLLSGGSPTPWASIATRPLPEPTSDPRAIRAASRERYGRPLSETEAGWVALAGQDRRVAEPLGRIVTSEGRSS